MASALVVYVNSSLPRDWDRSNCVPSAFSASLLLLWFASRPASSSSLKSQASVSDVRHENVTGYRPLRYVMDFFRVIVVALLCIVSSSSGRLESSYRPTVFVRSGLDHFRTSIDLFIMVQKSAA